MRIVTGLGRVITRTKTKKTLARCIRIQGRALQRQPRFLDFCLLFQLRDSRHSQKKILIIKYFRATTSLNGGKISSRTVIGKTIHRTQCSFTYSSPSSDQLSLSYLPSFFWLHRMIAIPLWSDLTCISLDLPWSICTFWSVGSFSLTCTWKP